MSAPQSPVYNAPLASFRDPGGRLIDTDGRILRVVKPFAVPDLSAFLTSQTAQKFAASGRLVRSRVLGVNEAAAILQDNTMPSAPDDNVGMVVEHERVPFPSFPYEWPPELLYAAGLLTLDLAHALTSEGLGLKDATPYNVLFRGAAPVFVDVLSAERRHPGDYTWLPYGQFVRTFLLPLLGNKYFGVSMQEIFSTRRDGLEAEDIYRLCGPLRKLTPPVLTLVTMPLWLGARHRADDTSLYQQRAGDSADKARFILGALFRHLRRGLRRVAPGSGKRSVWSEYRTTHSYTPEQSRVKQRFVEDAIAEFAPQRVLDVGCNTGDFSMIPAQRGARVIAIDSDPVVLGRVFRQAADAQLDVLPLVVDITRPTPATGWRNQECSSFLDRARGAFDAVFMLAIMHHMLVTERIPLEEIVDLAGQLTTDVLVIEFIAPDDPLFRRLVRGRDALFTGLTVAAFEAACKRSFTIVRSQRLEGTSRWLYVLRKNGRHAVPLAPAARGLTRSPVA
jgi:SAM-dependent methyltransferase